MAGSVDVHWRVSPLFELAFFCYGIAYAILFVLAENEMATDVGTSYNRNRWFDIANNKKDRDQ